MDAPEFKMGQIVQFRGMVCRLEKGRLVDDRLVFIVIWPSWGKGQEIQTNEKDIVTVPEATEKMYREMIATQENLERELKTLKNSNKAAKDRNNALEEKIRQMNSEAAHHGLYAKP